MMFVLVLDSVCHVLAVFDPLRRDRHVVVTFVIGPFSLQMSDSLIGTTPTTQD